MSNTSHPATKENNFWRFLRRINPFSLPVGKGNDAYGLAVIRGFLTVSVLAILLVGLINLKDFLRITGLSFAVAFATLLTGGLLGFLFGIPRSLQTNRVTQDNPNNSRYADNTNLEEISDWLTKIIVGISLVQFKYIEQYFNTLCVNITDALTDKDGISWKFGYAYAGALLLFYLICGFLSVYLWARTYLMDTLSGKDKQDLKKRMSMQERMLKIQNLENIKKDFQKTVQRIEYYEKLPQNILLVTKANPKPAVYCDDCQKGRWGGNTADTDYTVIATVFKDTQLDMRCKVNITVTPVTGSTKTIRSVLLMLHDSFMPEMIQKKLPDPPNTSVTYEFTAYEAFTVGLVVDNTDNTVSVYEVDLNQIPTAPDDFKYSDELLTITSVNEQLAKLESEAE